MKEKITEKLDSTKLELNEIKNTPFMYASNGEQNYIVCGKVLLETDKSQNECEDDFSMIPWDAVSVLCQAITNEMIKENKK